MPFRNHHHHHLINSSSLIFENIITTSSVFYQLTINKQQDKQKPRGNFRRRTTTTIINTITNTSFLLVNTTNINSSFFSSTSSTHHQQISFEDSYSAKTGIKTAALLGGMLLLVILYLIWKARARICYSSRSPSTAGIGGARLSTSKFDLEYWLKQVDLLEAKEAERNRGGQSLYLELPRNEARDNRQATASWISDTYRHWRLVQYRQQQQFLRTNDNQPLESNPIQYRRRRHLFRRFFRRFLTSPRQRSSFLMEHSPSLIAGMRPSIVSNNFIPLPLTPTLQPRRTSSWPRLKSNHQQLGAPMSALQTHLARKRLLKRTSRTTTDI